MTGWWLAEGRAQPSATRGMGCYCVLCLYWCSLAWAASIAQVDSVNPPVQLYWNRSNPLFTTPDAAIDVQMKDTINLWCPQNATPADSQPEVYVIYRVPESNYQSCSLPDGTTNQLLNVNITRVFNCSKFYGAAVRPQLLITDYPVAGTLNGGLTWLTGQTYYLMTASTGDYAGLGNLQPQASACQQFNMRLIIRVVNSSVLPPSSIPPTAPASSSSTTTIAPLPPLPTVATTGGAPTSSRGATASRTAAGSSSTQSVQGSKSPNTSTAARGPASSATRYLVVSVTAALLVTLLLQLEPAR